MENAHKERGCGREPIGPEVIQSTDRIPTCTKAPLEVGEDVPALSYHVSLSSD